MKNGQSRGYRTWKVIKCLAPAVVLLLVLTGCGAGPGSYPEEVNMGGMGDHHGHQGGSATPGASPTVSCAELSEDGGDEPVRSFHLTAAKTTLELNNGKTTEAWTYEGASPGPELRVQEGDRVVVQLDNKDIDKGVSIHWHGVVLPCSQDGVPGVTQDAVWPGESFTYEFVARHPGTYWYHSHQQSSEQATKGLIGRLIVEPREQTYAVDRDYAVTLQKLNNYQLTNGQTGGLALEAEPGETVRLRLVNAFNRVQRMGVAGTDFRVIAMDGQDLNEPTLLKEQWIAIGGGQRYDILFTMPEGGQVQVYSRDESEWSMMLGKGPAPQKLDKKAPMFDFTTYGMPLEDGITADMPFDRTYDLKLGGAEINGKRFHEIPPIIVKEGEWIKVRLEHQSGSEHPMHLHGHLFKILKKNGQPLTGSPVYVDSVMVDKNETYEIAFLADNPGLWMEHCHNLNHAANGMTMMVNYEGVTTPYRVGTKSGNLPD